MWTCGRRFLQIVLAVFVWWVDVHVFKHHNYLAAGHFFMGGSVGTDLQVTFGRDHCDCYCKVRQREETFALKLFFCFCQS